ncbi:hypothetical protein YPPY101_2459 [Yersinia pestis PY-101]|nr:hypothetical protein YPPY02_2502 [Yersinia pestis PY-02]EIT46063.1 hypothetical protein YPPY101_2459 [Yersinia pestis PY-101]
MLIILEKFCQNCVLVAASLITTNAAAPTSSALRLQQNRQY